MKSKPMGTTTSIKRVFDRRLAAVLMVNNIPLLGAFDDAETGKQYVFPDSEALEDIIALWKADAVLVNPKKYSAAWAGLRNAQLYQPHQHSQESNTNGSNGER